MNIGVLLHYMMVFKGLFFQVYRKKRESERIMIIFLFRLKIVIAGYRSPFV